MKSITMFAICFVYAVTFSGPLESTEKLLLLSASEFLKFTTLSWLLNIVNTYTHEVGFPCGSAGKESACNAGDLGSIPGLGRSPGEGKGYPLQYSGLENSVNCIVHGVAKS